LHFLLSDICGEESISLETFGKLLEWFGPLDAELLERIDSIVSEKWFHGSLNHLQAERIIANGKATLKGTFLVRFSERQSGTIAIAYKQSNSAVRHYLVQSSDITGEGRSLPTFIRDTDSLIYFVDIYRNVIDKFVALENIGNSRSDYFAENEEYDKKIFELDSDM